MKRRTFFLSILTLVLFLLYSCEENNPDTGKQPSTSDLQEKSLELAQSDNRFGFKLLKKINKAEETPGNIMISPFSVAFALGMTYNGAAGNTKTQMRNTLELAGLSDQQINASYQELIKALTTTDEKVTLSIANSVWYRQEFSVEQAFLDVNQTYYDAEVEALDFASPGTKDIINNWVANKTNDKITEIIDYISPETVMFLINAIYFNGIWKFEFEKEATSQQLFHLSDGTTKQVDMMEQEEDFNYLQTEKFKAIELPYGNGNYAMMICLPNTDYTVNDIINDLNDTNWQKWTSEFTIVDDLKVHLPKFKFSYEIVLNDVLKALGMPDAFSGVADFSRINSVLPLYISYVKHKTYIDVNEQGTEAAAVTVVAINYTSVGGGEKIFRVNRPFFFAIYERHAKSIVFAGKVLDPVYEE